MLKLATLLLALALAAATGAAQAQDSLYKRLGGYDAIAAVTDDFIGRLVADEEFGLHFAGDSDDTLRLTRQRIVDFICEAAGGPCYYTGRTMKVSHAGLEITAAQWDKAGALFGQTLDKFNVQGQLREDVGAFIASLRDDIVEVD
jgi:hemoglobin